MDSPSNGTAPSSATIQKATPKGKPKPQDAAQAIVLATERYDGAEPVNVGSAHEISIRELTELIAGIVGYLGRITWDPSQPNGQPRRKLDTSRAANAFGFRASTSFDDGLRRTVQYYLDEIAGVEDTVSRAQPAAATS